MFPFFVQQEGRLVSPALGRLVEMSMGGWNQIALSPMTVVRILKHDSLVFLNILLENE